MMYIAIENMGSAYGYKSKNTFCKSNSVKNKAKEKAKAKVYEQRQALAKRLGFDPKNDPADLNDMLSVAKNFAAKHTDTCRFGVSVSLRSMLKRVEMEANQIGGTFDTMVFVGHGNTGLMTVGIGNSPAAVHDASGAQKKLIEGMRQDERMINVENTDTWRDLFAASKKCFSADRNGIFHVVFAGCCAGNQSETSYKWITVSAATALAQIFQCKVNAYGPDGVITNEHVEEILGNIDSIRRGSVAGAKGEYQLNANESDRCLVWFKR